MENTNIELTPEEQATLDNLNGSETPEGDPVELPSDKQPDPEEGDEKFADKFNTVDDLRKGIESIGSDLPEYVLEGMSDAALEKHYLELQKNFHEEKSGRKHTQDKKPEDNEEEAGDKPEAVSAELWTELESYYNENGNITDDMYNKLNKVGIPDAVIDKYMDGLKSDQVAFTNEIYSIAGSEENYNTIKAWAEDTLPAAQIEAIGRMDKNGMILAMKGIKAEYDAVNGSNESTRLLGETRSSNNGAYKSQQEYILDIGDKRYGIDKKYTHAVDTKFSNSKNLQ